MYIADLHIHSKYSRATSRDCDAPHLELWARYKGIGLVGTGDFTHPVWREELREQLRREEGGLYVLKDEYRLPEALDVEPPRFVVTGEISSIYKKNGRTRKVHNVIILPDLEAADTLARRLEAIGNIHSDGRPILGLDSRDLLEITLEACPEALFIPAHIWTPHFSLFGAFSGFDSMEECFEDMTPHISGLETGLSSDPPMNWRVSSLDGLTLVSNSDAHSPSKLGREANLIEAGMEYAQLSRAIVTGEGFGGTIEFFPEEGKYHLDGHRNCHQRLEPAETERLGGRCPVCGKKITIGVLHRVEELADQPEGYRPPQAKPFESLVPLPEIIAASTGVSAASKKTQTWYFQLLRELGPEFYILREAPLNDIEMAAGPCIAEGVRRLREGRVERIGGYDGEYGTISLFDPEEMKELSGQLALFDMHREKPAPRRKGALSKERQMTAEAAEEPVAPAANPEQQRAVTSDAPVIAAIAGPGTGKTRTLVERIAYLVEVRGVKPGEITAVTFTNQAAEEMRARVSQRLGGKGKIRGMTIGTFHKICLGLLEPRPILGRDEAEEILKRLGARGSLRKTLQAISDVKNGIEAGWEGVSRELFAAYQAYLRKAGLRDLDDILLEGLAADMGKKRMFTHLLVDEFQDINQIQYQLTCRWAAQAKSLFVIGDPDQSIYGFRGVDAACFERLLADRPDAEKIVFRRNYRSTPQIVRSATVVIAHNGGEERLLEAAAPDGQPVRLAETATPFAEGVFIAKEIGRMAGGIDMLAAHGLGGEREARPFSDMAVLCRTHRELELIEGCLRHDSIPCVVTGREDYLRDDLVRGAVGFFRFFQDRRDVPGLEACLKYTWGCPEDGIAHATEFAIAQQDFDLAAWRQEFGGLGHVAQLLDALEREEARAKEKPAKRVEQWAQEHGKSQAMERLASAASFHATMDSFLSTLALGGEADLRRASGKSYASGAVRLMTLHGAKGLEFPVVFLAGLSKGALPLERESEPADVAEERRLFFVGMTRAREELVLTTYAEPSLFLEELPAEVQREKAGPAAREAKPEQLTLF